MAVSDFLRWDRITLTGVCTQDSHNAAGDALLNCLVSNRHPRSNYRDDQGDCALRRLERGDRAGAFTLSERHSNARQTTTLREVFLVVLNPAGNQSIWNAFAKPARSVFRLKIVAAIG